MSKPSAPRRVADNEAMAVSRQIRVSPRKLNVVAASIRGMDCGAAVQRLTFLHRRVAIDVRKVLQAAIANAENNHQLDVDRLYVKEASVGRTFSIKRFHARARGRAAKVEKPFSNLTVVVREREEKA
ncbi:MAG: 50S ribosomal protein L22 [Alphaproteobacteria bacterium]